MNARDLAKTYANAELEVARCQENAAFANAALAQALKAKDEVKEAFAVLVTPEQRRRVITLTDGRAMLVELVQSTWDKKESVFVSYVPLAG